MGFSDRLQKAINIGIQHGNTQARIRVPTSRTTNAYGDVIYGAWVECLVPALVLFHPSRELLDDFGFTDSSVTVVFVSADELETQGVVDKLDLGYGEQGRVTLGIEVVIDGRTMNVTDLRRIPYLGNEALMFIFSGKMKEVY